VKKLQAAAILILLLIPVFSLSAYDQTLGCPAESESRISGNCRLFIRFIESFSTHHELDGLMITKSSNWLEQLSVMMKNP